MHLRHLLVFAVANVNGHIADHAAHHAFVAQDVHTAAPRRGHIGAAHAVHVHEAFIADVLDHVTDLIGVRFKHDALALGVRSQQRGPGGAVGVVLHLVGKLAHPSGPLALARHFKPRGAGGVQQIQEKGLGGLGKRHGPQGLRGSALVQRVCASRSRGPGTDNERNLTCQSGGLGNTQMPVHVLRHHRPGLMHRISMYPPLQP